MKDLGLIQRFGRGINIAREAMCRNGNPPLEFDVDAAHVRCVLRKKATAKIASACN
jgi:ATP-dependent DNA helicase RecG